MIDHIICRLLLRSAVIKNLAHALLRQPVVFGDETKVQVASSAILHNALLNVSSGNIVVEENVFFGHNVCLLTGTHDYRVFGEDRRKAVPHEGCDIYIRSGAWVASNVTILGPAVIGEHAVIGAGSVVTENVPPRTVVAGVPARIIRLLENRALADK